MSSPIVWRFEEHETLGSTSDLCKTYADKGEASGRVVLARHQIAGRGTRGRDWIDPGGNLAVSVLLRFSPDKNPIAALPFMAALALYDAIVGFAPSHGSRFSLKWPNDLMLDERKMSGILIESGAGEKDCWIVVGFGANLVSAPEIPGRKLAAFSELGAPPDPMVLAHRIAHHLGGWLEIWETGEFAAIRAQWLARAHPVGRHLAVQTRETYITGRFSGLDEQGCLLLELQDGEIRPVVTGDIFLG